MADNIQLDSMVGGETVSTEKIGTSHLQRIKLVRGSSGTDDGDISKTNPLPVSMGLKFTEYDYFSVAYPNSVTEIFTFKTGGSGGSTVNTVTVVYTDDTKQYISTLTKT